MVRKTLSTVMLPATLTLACCDHSPDGDAIKAAVSTFLETARAGAHYEVASIKDVQCRAAKDDAKLHYCKFEMTLTDKDSGSAFTTREFAGFGEDGAVVASSKPTPWNFEQQAAAQALLAGQHFAGLGYRFDKVDPSCQQISADSDVFCSVKLDGHDGATAFSARVSGPAVLANGHWSVAVDPPSLNGTWENNDQIRLNFSKWGLSARVSSSEFSFETKPDGDGAMLIQQPAAHSLGGDLIREAGPVARCTYELSLIRLTITSCSYRDLRGTFYKTSDS